MIEAVAAPISQQEMGEMRRRNRLAALGLPAAAGADALPQACLLCKRVCTCARIIEHHIHAAGPACSAWAGKASLSYVIAGMSLTLDPRLLARSIPHKQPRLHMLAGRPDVPSDHHPAASQPAALPRTWRMVPDPACTLGHACLAFSGVSVSQGMWSARVEVAA